MRVAFAGITLPEGKTKYNDPRFIALAEKFKPQKLSPYYFEFLAGEFEAAQAIVIPRAEVLDLLIFDLEKIETRLEHGADDTESALLRRCQEQLENQLPLCDLALSSAEADAVRALGFLSFRPTLLLDADADSDTICAGILEKSAMMFFYTVGKQEVHAWLVARHATAETCAGRIHSDLQRGFIKAELFSYDDVIANHSLQDARAKGLMKLVDRDFPVPENSIIEIRFNV